MAMNLHDAVNHNGLFDLQGKAFLALSDLNTSIAVMPPAVQAVIDQYKLVSGEPPSMNEVLDGLAASVDSWSSEGTTISGPLAGYVADILQQFVLADAPQPANTTANALAYLIAQMLSGGYYVTPNVVAMSLAVGGGNFGDTIILYTPNRGDGRAQENTLGETISVLVTNDTSALKPTIQFTSPSSVSLLDPTWPKGSGTGLSINATSPDGNSNLVSNGNFETASNPPVPDDWQVIVGTPGTTINLTPTAVQTVTISGVPTGGFFILEYENLGGLVRGTNPIDFSPAASDVASALQALPGLSDISVSSAVVGSDTVFTITFSGVAGNIPTMTALNYLTGGTSPGVAVATITNGDNGAYRGQSLMFVSNGAELTTIQTSIDVDYDTVYFCHLRCKRVGAAAAGSIKIDVTSGVGGATTQDAQGNSNSVTVNATAIPTGSFLSVWFSFRLPPGIAPPLYLRIAIATAITNTATIYFDDVTVVAGQQLYEGGPWVQAISGAAPSVNGDNWTITVTNTRAGEIQEWYNRTLNMGGQELLLPSAGSTLIPNSVIS